MPDTAPTPAPEPIPTPDALPVVRRRLSWSAWGLGALGVMAFAGLRGDPRALERVFLDVGLTGWRTGWSVAAAAVALGLFGTLRFVAFPSILGRAAAALGAFLVSVLAAAQGIGDPSTAAAVGGSLGVLAGFLAFFVFGVEGEGGVAWAGALVAGLGGVVVFTGAMGALNDWGRTTGRAWAEFAGGSLGLGALGVAGGVPAAAVLMLRARLERYDAAFLSLFAGGLSGALVASVAWAFVPG